MRGNSVDPKLSLYNKEDAAGDYIKRWRANVMDEVKLHCSPEFLKTRWWIVHWQSSWKRYLVDVQRWSGDVKTDRHITWQFNSTKYYWKRAMTRNMVTDHLRSVQCERNWKRRITCKNRKYYWRDLRKKEMDVWKWSNYLKRTKILKQGSTKTSKIVWFII